MSTAQCLFMRIPRWIILFTLVWLVAVGIGVVAYGQTSTVSEVVVSRAVGGVSIDTDGVLSNARLDDLGELGKLRGQAMEKISDELNGAAEIRKISLRRLEAALEDCARNKKPIPDALKYLAGLQRIHYVFVYPEQKDIVLVGSGEGWRVDARGNVVGVVTGRPVLLLDDLLVALRTARAAANGGINCSIDPTREGLTRMGQVQMTSVRGSEQAQAAGDELAKALGMQQISVQGVPETSHFARILVAADYRMKRLAMNFDPAPVHGLPSYLSMVKPSRAVMTPRFWLEPKYDALLRDADGLAFELRGSSVKAMTEEDHLAAAGNIQHTGKASAAAQKWAEIMTQKYAELAVADPIFGQLQNCMELAVVGALVVKERLADKAGYSMTTLLESPTVKTDVLHAPKQVESKASVLKKGRNWVISASGGVAINSWIIADKLQVSGEISSLRTKAAAAENAGWWWN